MAVQRNSENNLLFTASLSTKYQPGLLQIIVLIIPLIIKIIS